ncbi:MAG: FecR family protein [Butyricimonas faecalis]
MSVQICITSMIPRGGEYVLTLADGTLVCLNTGSITFPVQFSGITRNVNWKGRIFSSGVMKNTFCCQCIRGDITVLGTEFNVSNYPENEDVQTTLVKGKVQVTLSEDMDGYILNPGEQAVYNKESGEVTVANVDVSYVTAWREGRLRFRDRPLKEIMDFISRWYDVDVVYEDESVKNYLFGCNFNRHVTVTPLLELFQSTGTVRFEVVGKKIIVKK